jgi:hypothetical protein
MAENIVIQRWLKVQRVILRYRGIHTGSSWTWVEGFII